MNLANNPAVALERLSYLVYANPKGIASFPQDKNTATTQQITDNLRELTDYDSFKAYSLNKDTVAYTFWDTDMKDGLKQPALVIRGMDSSPVSAEGIRVAWHGDKTGNVIVNNNRDALLNIINELKQKNIKFKQQQGHSPTDKDNDIYIAGHSLGGLTAMSLTGLVGNEDLEGVYAYSTPADLPKELQESIPSEKIHKFLVQGDKVSPWIETELAEGGKRYGQEYTYKATPVGKCTYPEGEGAHRTRFVESALLGDKSQMPKINNVEIPGNCDGYIKSEQVN